MSHFRDNCRIPSRAAQRKSLHGMRSLVELFDGRLVERLDDERAFVSLECVLRRECRLFGNECNNRRLARFELVGNFLELGILDTGVAYTPGDGTDDAADECRGNQAGWIDQADDTGDDRAPSGSLRCREFLGLMDLDLAFGVSS